ncbi:hypothetical protein IGB42_02550 [Andreprevotia sp. IGB-42]|uniref:hypothetical protein n=1 Tax=Andreprevotia sp. IGB-42 TaxID=2497473 RepID=UPI00135B090E|nr:hypothetical protein [Andreprevotia sp. IGB-42]KAF0813149.1 hypothetical protein IGB42_02550 [Andreprevotia sp. IGB-42]
MKISIPSTISEIDQSLGNLPDKGAVEVNIDPFFKWEERQKIPLYTSSLIQWILSVWRREETFFSGLHVTGGGFLQQLSQTAPGLFLSLLPNGKVDGVDRKQSADFRRRYLEAQQNWPDLASSFSEILICVDSLPKLLPKQLYLLPEERTLIDSEAYGEIFRGILKSLGDAHDAKSKLRGREDAICSIIFELFKNTHDHARHGIEGVELVDSIRGIYTDYYPIEYFDSKYFQKVAGEESTPLSRYIGLVVGDHIRKDASSEKKISGFLEITIFDSGPGLAAKLTGKSIADLTSELQYEDVIKCFGKGYSSTTSGARGFGLWKVLSMLRSLNGLIRVRTNKVHLSRDFRALQGLGVVSHAFGEKVPDNRLYDWTRGFLAPISEYPSIEGTNISVFIPLEGL